MPAIRPAQLKQESALLANDFGQPEVYIHKLHHLLDQYANRAYRPGKTGKPKPLLESYDVPAPVLRQLLLDLESRAVRDPERSLALSRALWDEPYFETRMLAAGLLGKTPARPATILNQLHSFLQNAVNEQVISALLNQGLARLRQTAPEWIVEQAEKWLSSSQELDQIMGLRILEPLIVEPGYENVPVFFRLLTPWVCEAPAFLRPDLVDVVEVLARRSPYETAYFLRENLARSTCSTTAWLTRQVLTAFPEEVRLSLREYMRGKT